MTALEAFRLSIVDASRLADLQMDPPHSPKTIYVGDGNEIIEVFRESLDDEIEPVDIDSEEGVAAYDGWCLRAIFPTPSECMLMDSDSAATLSESDLGCTDEEYRSTIIASLIASGPQHHEGHVLATNGRRVYAQ